DINNTYKDTAVSGNVLTNDEDYEGDIQTVTTPTVITVEGVAVTIDSTTGIYSYTPPTGFVGTDSFEYTICDNGTPQACSTAKVTIEVMENPSTDTNSPPVANDDTAM
ncbi:Ig-like domain-containing protein, partial [uncultured Lutibacter sp.]|uniref:Ig-like domain-containing protein n=1 Tax=uncultured Lutibacter sp. TaxID=437739 RepID=UPI002633BA95